jgi:hypothetical protein
VEPYVIKQGDHLSLLAYKFDFDAGDVWNDPANEALRNLSRDPDMLAPGDVLYIPDQIDKDPAKHSLAIGQTNTFTTEAPTVDLQIKFADPEFASMALTVPELPDVTGLSTDGDGIVHLTLPVTLQAFTVIFTADGTTFECRVAHVDPVGTRSGVIQRLQNLGYLDPSAAADVFEEDEVQGALDAFVAAHTSDDRAAPDAADDGGGETDQGAADDDAQTSSVDKATVSLLKRVHGS